MSKCAKDVSVRGEPYAALRAYCLKHGLQVGPTVSQWIEDRLTNHKGRPVLYNEAALDSESRKYFTY